ncbi:acyl-CoA thioesterase [Salisediminibacterium selenitireducens]|uniref:Thioesterase superfamily protein n=1 Tax=Bacillus selenitireducens (strain ATCC 700615 / DSM 15326 / MLS10) TaxID=439292 RepID=D6XU96_BACIE|nr:thioesterase family protein [Salisediminibacterium selenitireducens]ADH99382.1 thioesterase superfamily protein [[Bacillus] selenitireducens MLS10]
MSKKICKVSFPVRYAETDQMGVVYHANYVIWCEIGRTSLIEDMGFHYADMEREGVLSPVTNISLSYLKPAKYGQDVRVETMVKSYNGVRVTYGYEIYAGDDCLVTGESEHVCVDAKSFRPIQMKKRFPEWDKAYKERLAQ